jgi:hypothetical protein
VLIEQTVIGIPGDTHVPFPEGAAFKTHKGDYLIYDFMLA